MLLFYSAGINITVACSLTWGDLIFEGIPPFQDCCQIHLSKEKTVGAAHDYTHPIFRFGAHELKRRYEAIKFSGDPRIDKRKILGGLTATALTAFCRTCLQYLGVSHQTVEEAKSKRIGGGVMLLLQDYYYRLIHHCGIRSSAELKYLRMHSLGMDVTADNYRSLSSPSGQKRLQLLLNRDTRFEPENVKSTVTVTTTDAGYRTFVIPPHVPSRTTAVTFRIRMKRGQKITILSEEGLKGTAIPLGNLEREPASAPTTLGSQQLSLWEEA